MDHFLGTILAWPIAFAPRGWAYCTGQIVAIQENTALYALIGNTYGGDRRVTFALPDLRGRVIEGVGQGIGLHPNRLGLVGGVEAVTLDVTQLATHKHDNQIEVGDGVAEVDVEIPGNSSSAGKSSPDGKTLGGGHSANIYTGKDGDVTLKSFKATGTATASVTLENVTEGNSQSFKIKQPYLCLNYIICLAGTFPPRN